MRIVVLASVFSLTLTSCVHVKMDPVTVEPIQVRVDVFLTVDRELDGFFRELDKTSRTVEQ